ncbi:MULTISPECIES: hypothetical protein [Desulfococcus]|uniref:hypothetical protein n=1 Tax=Desulfococcus TaxID=896 RepID=UPI00058E8584|nr:hypothetical protein [Desulfococcus multivorans]
MKPTDTSGKHLETIIVAALVEDAGYVRGTIGGKPWPQKMINIRTGLPGLKMIMSMWDCVLNFPAY